MGELSQVMSTTSNSRGIGFVVAAVIVVLVLLYALFAGDGATATVDPASVGQAD